MTRNLICEYNGEIIAMGTVRTIEEFLSVEIPNKYPDIMTHKEFKQWLSEQKHWRLA